MSCRMGSHSYMLFILALARFTIPCISLVVNAEQEVSTEFRGPIHNATLLCVALFRLAFSPP